MTTPTHKAPSKGGSYHYDETGKLLKHEPPTAPPKRKSEIAAEEAVKAEAEKAATAPTKSKAKE